jgi:hypothetical protein
MTKSYSFLQLRSLLCRPHQHLPPPPEGVALLHVSALTKFVGIESNLLKNLPQLQTRAGVLLQSSVIAADTLLTYC